MEDSKPKTPKVIQLSDAVPNSKPNLSANFNGIQSLKLVGSIQEKGFSDNKGGFKEFTIPQPRVTGFPKARHRSDKIWRPHTSEPADKKEKMEDEEDIGAEHMVHHAKPITRKKKVDFDFGNWKEKLGTENSDVKSPVEKQKIPHDGISNGGAKDCGMERSSHSSTPEKKGNLKPPVGEVESEDKPGRSLDVTNVEKKHDSSDSAKTTELRTDKTTVLRNVSNEQNSFHDQGRCANDSECKFNVDPSMEEIDADSRALLNSMSAAEISEAQQELFGRLKPEAVEKLRKRAIEKATKVNKPAPEKRTKESHPEKNDLDSRSRSSDFASTKEVEISDKGKKTIASKIDRDPISANLNYEWESWSSRVEAAKNVRFSLDGNVLKLTPSDEKLFETGEESLIQQSDIQNVAERDILRTDGDPACFGYTVKEAVSLVRSTVPGQRAVALQLVGSIIERCMSGLLEQNIPMDGTFDSNLGIDWQAIWAYMLGPEGGLVLTLRLALDDSHSTVVAACTKVLQCLLSYSENEHFISLFRSLWAGETSIFLASIFRRKSKIDEGFLGGGFWKYSAKQSSMFPCATNADEDGEEEGTIADDQTVAAQDVAAGLIRMQILPRIRYILEVDQLTAAEDSCLGIIICLARHSPTAADAVMTCPRLIDTILQRYILHNTDLKVEPVHVKALRLITVLCEAKKSSCVHFIRSGAFQIAVRHLFCQYTLGGWLEFGHESFKHICAALVEELRFWKSCIYHGQCISCFSDFYPALCFWLTAPSYEKLINEKIVDDTLNVTRESYNVLRALAKTLPNLHDFKSGKDEQESLSREDSQVWSWSQAVPMVDVALEWFDFRQNPFLYQPANEGELSTDRLGQDSCKSSVLGVIASVLNTLSSIFEKLDHHGGSESNIKVSATKFLPVFVRHIYLKIINSGLLHLLEQEPEGKKLFSRENTSLFEYLCFLRKEGNDETSLAASVCLQGIIKLVTLVDRCIDNAWRENAETSSTDLNSTIIDQVIKTGLIKSSQQELESAGKTFAGLVTVEWQNVQSSEMFGRGGPAPGVGRGWGSGSGGFLSVRTLLSQADARVAIMLLELLPVFKKGCYEHQEFQQSGECKESLLSTAEILNATLSTILIPGPRDKETIEKALGILFSIPIMKTLCFYANKISKEKARYSFTARRDDLEDSDYKGLCEALLLHFKNYWLTKKKQNTKGKKKMTKSSFKSVSSNAESKRNSLDTICEETTENESMTSDGSLLVIEWARQRAPLPVQWLLSSISTSISGNSTLSSFTNVSQQSFRRSLFNTLSGGLFFLLGLEAIFFYCNSFQSCPVLYIPLVRKVHALSMAFIVGGDMFLEDPIKELIFSLQEVYLGALINTDRKISSKLNFQREIIDSYEPFVESLVEHFAATSYGDLTYGRQIAIYLRRDVEPSIRLATWNALVNNEILNLLPTLEECCGNPKDYFFPIENHVKMIEAYMSAWISGALDRAKHRMSATFSLALHHLSCFIFMSDDIADNSSMRKKLIRNLLLDSYRKSAHKDLMTQLVLYNPSGEGPLGSDETTKRIDFLLSSCEGDPVLCDEVKRIQSAAINEKCTC